MYLKDLINTASNVKINNIKLNSKDLKENDLFIPFGGVEDRNKYISDALRKKSVVVTDLKVEEKNVFNVSNLNDEIINIFDKYYNYPLKNINLIGVTGTDGKTTVASIISDLLLCPSIGTNGFRIKDKTENLNNTTPAIDVLYSCFNEVNKFKYSNVVMEVSSEAYLTNRIGNLNFNVAILTNITKDHLDKHKTIENYVNSKLELFKHSNISILNRDSEYYELFKNNSKISYSYGFSEDADINILKYKLYLDKSVIWFKYQNKSYMAEYSLLGEFNVMNISACILTLLALGYNIDEILEKIKLIKPVLGRMELVYNDKYKVYIDYAHTENATLNVLKFFSERNKNIITVVGSAGGRYKEKRKIIGEICLKYSKLVIFTMDDPRYEDPVEIAREMIGTSHKKNYLIEVDRELAIKKAIDMAKENDVILLLGKGRDNYMAIEDQKIPYSDYDTLKKVLNIN